MKEEYPNSRPNWMGKNLVQLYAAAVAYKASKLKNSLIFFFCASPFLLWLSIVWGIKPQLNYLLEEKELRYELMINSIMVLLSIYGTVKLVNLILWDGKIAPEEENHPCIEKVILPEGIFEQYKNPKEIEEDEARRRQEEEKKLNEVNKMLITLRSYYSKMVNYSEVTRESYEQRKKMIQEMLIKEHAANFKEASEEDDWNKNDET